MRLILKKNSVRRAYLEACHGQDGDADDLVHHDVLEPVPGAPESEDHRRDADEEAQPLDGDVAVEPVRVLPPEVARHHHAHRQQHAPAHHGQQPVPPLRREPLLARLAAGARRRCWTETNPQILLG